MAEYHKYVFDSTNRSFVGEFEAMYQQEAVNNFDSWHQDDSRQLNRQIALSIIEQYNFGIIVDLGSGKGALTHKLKRINNHVLGVDISETAVALARTRFPDIEFEAFDINSSTIGTFLDGKYRCSSPTEMGIDLVFCAETLSYLSNWKRLIKDLSSRTNFLLINLYLPEDPIGFVKSSDELVEHIAKFFQLIECVKLSRSSFTIVFAKNMNFGSI
jgi:SAM-dependent methyltransferase